MEHTVLYLVPIYRSIEPIHFNKLGSVWLSIFCLCTSRKSKQPRGWNTNPAAIGVRVESKYQSLFIATEWSTTTMQSTGLIFFCFPLLDFFFFIQNRNSCYGFLFFFFQICSLHVDVPHLLSNWTWVSVGLHCLPGNVTHSPLHYTDVSPSPFPSYVWHSDFDNNNNNKNSRSFVNRPGVFLYDSRFVYFFRPIQYLMARIIHTNTYSAHSDA